MKTYLQRAAQQNRDKTAYIIGNDSVTYGELWERACDLAELLKRQGTGPVILYGGKEIPMIVGILACILAGRAYVPADRFLPEARIGKIIRSSGAKLLLREGEETFDGILCLSITEMERYRDADVQEGDGDTAYILFTSGSTGEPKGVPISYGNLTNFVRWLNRLEVLASGGYDAVLNQASFSFDLSAADLFYSLTGGHTLTSPATSEPAEISDVIRRNRIQLCVVTPTFMKLCLLDPDFDAAHLPSLACVYFCGEMLEPKTVRRLWERFPGLEIINAYGPTEAASAVSAVRIRRDMLDWPLLPVGEAGHFATEIEIRDGEIVLLGDSVFGGYLDGISGGHFTENGVNGYRTGDLGHMENGYLFCRGRTDSQIKYKGYRIELTDIERNMAALPGAGDCAVTAVRGTDGSVSYIAAYVTGEAAGIREKLREFLPAYMIPKIVKKVDRLPVNANGKTDRKALLEDGYRKNSV